MSISIKDFVQGKGGTLLSLQDKYRNWIEAYVERQVSNPRLVGDWDVVSVLRGSCLTACREMRDVFPDLLLVRGGVISQKEAEGWSDEDLQEFIRPDDGHFWLETADGKIVDPTRKQFRSESLYYIAFDESKADQMPTGNCCNCGGYCYGGRTILCSKECELSYAAYIAAESA